MIFQEIRLTPWMWTVLAYYNAGTESAEGILAVLEMVGCKGHSLERAEDNLMSGLLNSGLTYTNPKHRTTVMVINESTGPEQFWNTLDHEKGHVVEHIAEALDIDRASEEYQYLRGYLAQMMYPAAAAYVCPCGRRIKD